MNFDFLRSGSRADNVLRVIYIATVAVLALYARQTYTELQRQRSAPVILPHYAFDIVNTPEKASVVRVMGTWYVEASQASAQTLETTTIECIRARAQCVESTATVSVSEKGILDSISTVFDVERWSEDEILTHPYKGQCTTRTVRIDLANRLASSAISALADAEPCKEQPRTLKLGSGARAHAEAMGKAQ